MNPEIDWKQFKDLFPIIGRVTERPFRRLKALRKLHEKERETDEATQLKKVRAKEILSGLVKLEEWR